MPPLNGLQQRLATDMISRALSWSSRRYLATARATHSSNNASRRSRDPPPNSTSARTPSRPLSQPVVQVEPVAESSKIKGIKSTREDKMKASQVATLTEEIGQRIRVDSSSKNILLMRQNVKRRIEGAIQRKYGDKYYVQFFGSTRYGVSYSDSDLDMTIIDPDNPQGFKKKKHISAPIYNVHKLAACIRNAGFSDVECRPHALVPIVKFRDQRSGLECDLNVNERLGIQNSTLIHHYCELFPPLRSMLFDIKDWAKPLDLNSPSVDYIPASFSSYALALMTIAFLQVEGFLPNLQANLPKDSPKKIWTLNPRRGWSTQFHRNVVPRPLGEGSNVDDLLQKWFRFWATFPYETQCISIRHGGLIDRSNPEVVEASSKSKAPSPICVVDPFIRVKNCARAVSRAVLQRFEDECAAVSNRHVVQDQTTLPSLDSTHRLSKQLFVSPEIPVVAHSPCQS